MAQLRHDYDDFKSKEAEILVIGPENSESFKNYFAKQDLPFIGIPDPTHQILKSYGQQVNLFKLGRMPAQMIIDKLGILRFIHYGHNMTDIPENQELLLILDTINSQENS